MAPDRASSSKRKRSNIPDSHESTPRSTPRKRQKKKNARETEEAAEPVQLTQSSNDSEPFYEARAILKETKNKYLIDWADNPETGEKYQPTWEPKRNANKQLVEDWKLRKLAEKQPKRQGQKPASAPRPAAAGSSQADGSPAPALPSATTPRRTPRPPKRHRVVQISSPEPRSQAGQLPVLRSLPDDGERVIPETEPRDNRPPLEAQVVVTQPTDYNPSDYEHFSASQIPWGSSQASIAFPSTTQSTVNSSKVPEGSQAGSESYYISAEQLLHQPRFGNGAVVPDSQSLHADSSYVPSTQTRSGAESQLAQSQPQPVDPAATRTQQDSSASASAQFTNSQHDPSARVPETDPIEDVPSSPAERSFHEEQVPLQRESPLQTASSTSSPPPTESPDKSTQSQNQPEDSNFSQEGGHVDTHPVVADEQAQESEAEPVSRSLSPKTRLEGQDQVAPQSTPIQEESGVEQPTEDREAREETFGVRDVAVQTSQAHGQEEPAQQTTKPRNEESESDQREQEPDEPAQQTTESQNEESEFGQRGPEQEESAQQTTRLQNEESESDQREQEQEGPAQQTTALEEEESESAQRNPEQEETAAEKDDVGGIYSAEVNAQGTVTEEHLVQQQTETPPEASGDSRELQRFVTCPEGPELGATEPSNPENTVDSSRQDPAEISTQDFTDPENPAGLRYAQREPAFEPTSSSTTGQVRPEQTNSQQWQPAQHVPEIDLDNPQSRDHTDSTYTKPAEPGGDSKPTQNSKRKESSQDSVEPSVLSQTDPNVVRRPAQQVESDVLSPKDIVQSIERRTESPIRGYYRKSSRGMPQTPQPNSSISGIDPSTPKSLTEQIREVQSRSKAERERKKAELLASRYDNPAPKSPSLEVSTRSPSVIPPHGPQPTMEPQYTLMPSNLSAEARPNSENPHTQNEHNLPEIHHPGSDTEMHDDSSPSILLEEPFIGEAEYLIGLSMEGLQGDQYRREINFKKEEITDFTENDTPEESSISGVRELIEKVGNVITHMDLGYANEDSLTQYDDNSKVLVAWSNNSSTKFRFLGGVLDRLRYSKMHFVILGRAGALMDIIETFVGGMDIQYARGGDIDHQAFEVRDSLFVTILATDFSAVDTRIPTAHLIFAMDLTVRCNEPKIKALRNHLRGPKDSIPVITPIATNSLEHVERCISPSLQGLARERLVVRFMTELRQLAGRVDVSTKADHAVNLIVPSIETDLDHHEAWPLPRVSSIKPDVHFDESMISSLSVSSSVPMGTMNPSVGQKRHIEIEEDEPAKRARITPQPEPGTINPNDITRVSDSVPGISQAHGVSSKSSLDEHIRTYRKDEKLRKELKYTKERLKEFEEALETCQTEKEEQKELIFHLKKETTDLKQSQINYSERIRTQNGTIEGLRNERNTLKQQLNEARNQLATSTVPEVAEREQLRRERDDALAKLERAQKTRETENKESEFFRSQYQDASNRASELSGEVTSLTQQLREFERLASGERERARQLTLNAATDAYRDEVEMLRAQLRDREDTIKQKTDEIKAIRGRQGVGTRAGSVPRSPRITGGPGSRGGSPAPSGLGGHGRLGALRNINA